MPSISASQGMGQYRYDKSYKYIDNEIIIGQSESAIKPEYRIQGDSIQYRDIQIPLPSSAPIRYGTTYYLHLELPQHIQYTTTVKVKICTSEIMNSNQASLTNFQTIRELIIPPAPPIKDEDALENIILYEDPLDDDENGGDSPMGKKYQADIIYDWPAANGIIWKPNNVYRFSDSLGNICYYKSDNDPQPENTSTISVKGPNPNRHVIINYSIGKIEKRWLTASSEGSIASFDIVFTPTYDLGQNNGYPFILLEIDRSGGYQTQIQYIGTNGFAYYGTYMEETAITGKLYTVSNLLSGSSIINTPIKSNTNTLNHIAVWSHPELLLAVNGEEIKIGQSNFYELNDFTITSLGVVAKDSSDRFTIDYQYRAN